MPFGHAPGHYLPVGELAFETYTCIMGQTANEAGSEDHVLFRRAVAALDAGDAAGLSALLDERPSLIRYRCYRGQGYESGYFAGATLLEHIAGNPDRGPLPPALPFLAKLL